ncbi:MAG TPA: class I SAM-dependent methyltransferase [Thermoanaerobaculia bacterium]|nr:class I SAM-dependent methyltransferase [Thermoanaerobaculia bacterium]
MTWYQEWFGEEYLDLYSYRNEEEAKLHVTFLRRQWGLIREPVLDLACGSGRHVQELLANGYTAAGADLSLSLLRRARAAGLRKIVRADMRRLPFPENAFGGLTSFFTSFGYFENEDDNAAVVHEMARVLRKGALFLFDYLNVHRELASLVQRETREIDGREAAIERWFDAASRTLNKRIIIGEKRFLERVRAYDLDEISTLFAAAGFAIRDVFGDFDGSPFEIGSRRLILVGTRRR